MATVSATVEPILERLKGKKHLILGNHDPSWIEGVDAGKHFASVEMFYSGTIEGRLVTMCHYPMLSWPQDKNSYMIYGHIHNNTDADYWPYIASHDQMLNAGVDVNAFSPVSLDEMIVNNQHFKEGAHGKR